MAGQSLTSLGGPGFVSTAWSVIRQAQDPASPEYRSCLERLMRLYWRPVYWTLRLDWNESRENALDMTQQYFAMFLEKNLLDGLAASRGRFRGFVKVSLKNFMLQARRAEQAEKRGGGAMVLSLDAAEVDRVESEAKRDASTPDKLFDRELVRSVLDDACRELERELIGAGRRDRFDLFMRYYSKGETYEALAAGLKLSVTDVTNRLFEVRRRYRQLVMDRLRDGIASDEELAAEARELLEE